MSLPPDRRMTGAARRWGVGRGGSRLLDGRQVVVRYLWLVVAGYLGAMVVVGFGVWLSAQPKLQQMTRDALTDQAATRARALDDRLRQTLEAFDRKARSDAIRDFVTGHAILPEPALEGLAGLDDRPNIRFLLLDYRGVPLLKSPGFDLRQATSLFSTAEMSSVVQGLVERSGPSISLREQPGDVRVVHGLFAVPVLVGGLVEGALVVERAITLEDLGLVSDTDGGPGWTVLTDFQRQQHALWHALSKPPIGAPVGETGLHVVVRDKGGRVRTLGRELVRDVLLFVIWGLALPFLGMALFGRSVIAKPYDALAASRRRLTQSQREVAELAKIATMADDSVLVTDARERIVWANPSFETLTGYRAADCIGRRPKDILQGAGTSRKTRARIREALDACRPVREEILNYRKDGTPYWISVSISPLVPEDGGPLRFVAISSDITEQKENEARLEDARRETEYHALHDALTGLPNRRALDILLEETLDEDAPPRTLVRIDLDHFKAVNDTHGHAAGDHVLAHVSRLLRSRIAEGDFAGRIGGDEFVIALAEGRGAAEGAALAERLQTEIREDVVFEGKTCRVGASFGIADSASGLVGNDGLLVAADAALYEAKERGRNQTVVYASAIHAALQSRRKLSAEIERGIAREEFVPLFQPQIDARTRRISGAEVLVRWQHPERGLLTPDQFLPLAGRLSMVPEIDRIVFRLGLQAAADLERVGQPLPKISFNMGAAQIEDPELLVLTDRFPLQRTQIAFEILESVLLERQSSNFRFHVDRLRERGYRIEIDDFGSGHASVVGLMQLNPDGMKIDQRLIIPITSSERIRDLVSHIVGIGRSFSISVTAEGVESQRHVDILCELGCDTMQGFHYARPLNVVDLLDMVESVGTTGTGPSAMQQTEDRPAM